MHLLKLYKEHTDREIKIISEKINGEDHRDIKAITQGGHSVSLLSL